MTPSVLHDHFFEPRNVGDLGRQSFCGRAGAVNCGATARISICVDDAQRISQIRFKAAGCSVLVATASYLTELVQQKTTAEAGRIACQPAEQVLEVFDVEDSNGIHCAQLAHDAMLAAITQYSDSVRTQWEGEEALICTCFCVSESMIASAIRNTRADTIAEVTRACRAGGGCRSCWPLIEDMLEND